MEEGKDVAGVAINSARVVERVWRVVLSSLSSASEVVLSAWMRA